MSQRQSATHAISETGRNARRIGITGANITTMEMATTTASRASKMLNKALNAQGVKRGLLHKY